MKLFLLSLAIFVSVSSFAECRLRVEMNPAYSNSVLKSLQDEARDKKYTLIKDSDDRWEEFRISIGTEAPASEKTGEKVFITLKKFVAPIFETIFQKSVVLENGNRDLLVTNYLKKIPSCHQALYGDIFASLD